MIRFFHLFRNCFSFIGEPVALAEKPFLPKHPRPGPPLLSLPKNFQLAP
jgi:hypothetical protein